MKKQSQREGISTSVGQTGRPGNLAYAMRVIIDSALLNTTMSIVTLVTFVVGSNGLYIASGIVSKYETTFEGWTNLIFITGNANYGNCIQFHNYPSLCFFSGGRRKESHSTYSGDNFPP